jgi:hypothetical protein
MSDPTPEEELAVKLAAAYESRKGDGHSMPAAMLKAWRDVCGPAEGKVFGRLNPAAFGTSPIPPPSQFMEPVVEHSVEPAVVRTESERVYDALEGFDSLAALKGALWYFAAGTGTSRGDADRRSLSGVCIESIVFQIIGEAPVDVERLIVEVTLEV